MIYAKSLIDNSQSTYPTNSNINIASLGNTLIEIFSDEGDISIAGGDPISADPAITVNSIDYVGGISLTVVSTPVVTYELTINVTGLPEEYEVAVDDVVWVDHKKAFDAGTVLTDLTPTVDGYTLAPVSVDEVVMDANKTLNFVATADSPYSPNFSVYVNPKSEFNSDPTTNPAFVNVAQPSNAVLQTVNGYTSPNLVTTANVPTGITFKNSGAFGGGVGEISSAQTSAGNTGVYENAMVNTGWEVNGGTSAKLNFLGLNPVRYYQFYFLMPSAFSDTVRSITMGATTITRNATTSALTFGTSGNGLDDAQFMLFKNITGVTTIEALVNRVSGNFVADLAMFVIQESNTPKP